MELRTAYEYIASGQFAKFCDENEIDLKNTTAQIRNLTNAIMIRRESRLVKNMESFLMKQID